MEPTAAAKAGSTIGRDAAEEFNGQFVGEQLHCFVSLPPENPNSSFTALLGLPANQAMELLVQAPDESAVASAAAKSPLLTAAGVALRASAPPPLPPPIFSSDAAKFSCPISSEENLRANLDTVKQEPGDSNSDPNSPAFSNPIIDQNPKPTTKRKDQEKKGKESCKKSKKAANETSEEGKEKLPYVHVRARRGQATDSHSLAERARREKINARMKLLQELVPGCNKISGTAMVLDEIINHVQSLQRQVEYLSMRLAAVNPRIDFNLDTLMAAESGSTADSNYPGNEMPSVWPEGPMRGNRQEYQQQWHLNGLNQPVWAREDENYIFMSPDNSLLTYDSSGNSAPLHSNQLKNGAMRTNL